MTHNSGWSLSDDFLNLVKAEVPSGSTILEFGSGDGTEKLCENYTVYSIEENKDFVGKYHDNYLHAEVVGDWYNKDKVIEFIRDLDYAAIIIDGPAYGLRTGILDILEHLNLDVPIFIDDIDRPDDKSVFLELSEYFQNKTPRRFIYDFIFYGGIL